MANKHGDWIWYELMTTDADAATAFYQAILPWKIGNPGQDGFDYRVIAATEGAVGGMLALTPEMMAGGARPVWVGYIKVDDVDKAVTSVEHGGGSVYMPARDMPGIGRFAMVADPQGAAFYVMKPTPPADNPQATCNAFAAERPMDGHCAWNELRTADDAGALHFYGTHFGWVKDGEMDMGPIGTYHFIRHGAMIGGIMPSMPQVPVSAWNFYFRVPDIDAAAAAVTANGGQVLHGPIEVPGGDFSMNGMDPQGAMFAVVGKRKG
ncbi:MAG: VOC family protein [Gammaproteobacteria bacterium]|nr:VOC family protein [Gammaproteobacteria bacterium]